MGITAINGRLWRQQRQEILSVKVKKVMGLQSIIGMVRVSGVNYKYALNLTASIPRRARPHGRSLQGKHRRCDATLRPWISAQVIVPKGNKYPTSRDAVQTVEAQFILVLKGAE